MKQSIFWIISLVFICLFTGCGPNEEECVCMDSEVCINNVCYLDEWVHELGGTSFIARNSYVGIINGNQCIDTLIFYNDTTRAIDNERFGLIVASHPGIQNVLGSEIPFEVSDNEFYASSVTALCYLNGDSWFANLQFKTYPDSVWMKLRFWTLGAEPGVFIDSSIVTFYRKP